MKYTQPIADTTVRNDFTTGKISGGPGNDHLIHHRDLSVKEHASVGLAGFGGDDILEGSVPRNGQIHMFGAAGNDWFILDVTKIPDAVGVQGHHAYGGHGQDTFQFKNIDENAAPIIGRLDDFDPTSDRILIENTEINLADLPKSIKLPNGDHVDLRVIKVEHPEFIAENLGVQNFLAIGDSVFYALDGARDLKNGPSGLVGEERHFLKSSALETLRTAETVQYENPKNFVPRDFYEDRVDELAINWNQYGTEVTAETGGKSAAHMFGSKGNLEAQSSNGGQVMRGSSGDDVIDANNGNDTVFGGDGNDLIAGGIDNDVAHGDRGDDMIWGGDGDDSLAGGSGDDVLDGGSGTDTAYFSGNQASYSLLMSATATVITDRRSIEEGGQGTDRLTSLEFLDFDTGIPLFDGRPMPLDIFDSPVNLTAEDFSAFAELYIAYFNRAPDAIGLYYWASELDQGSTLLDTAMSLFPQVETQATYRDLLSADGTELIHTGSFITAVYNNVLGRGPDTSGFNYWVDKLENNGNITPANFILALINGAKFGEDTPESLADRVYLSNKVDIGLYYSAIKGLSDVEASKQVMAHYDGSEASTFAAVAEIDSIYADALNPENGEFLMQLVGVIDDPFAVG